MIAFKLENVTLGYGGHPAVHHIEGNIATGSLTAIIGPNGSGKSTLMKGLAGMLEPMDGHIQRDCDRRDIAYLPQAAELDRSFPATVADFIATGLWHRRGLFAKVTQSDRADIASALAAVGLSEFGERGLDTLSGGQFQRVLFARVVLQDARVILLDEPFTAVDSRTTHDLLGVIARWHLQGRTVLAVLHDMDLVRHHFPNAILLARDVVAWGASAEVVTQDNLMKARAMHEAWDDDAPDCERSAA